MRLVAAMPPDKRRELAEVVLTMAALLASWNGRPKPNCNHPVMWCGHCGRTRRA